MSAADAALAAAEAAGVRLYLRPDGQVGMRAAAPPPADVLVALRQHREAVAALLAARQAAEGAASAPGWLAGVARSIRAALTDGAARVADAEGWLSLIRPDGRRVVVSPDTIAGITAAGLMPDLPAAVGEPAEDDPDALAERAAIQGEPAPPPVWRAEDAPPDWPFAGLPPRAFKVIIADPPWTFRAYSDKGLKKSPQMHYACMDLDAIKALPVAALAHPDGCALALWATAPCLPQAFEVMAAWGFRYSTCGAWAKQSRTGTAWHFGTGHVLRSAAEFWLIGTVGSPPVLARNVRNLIAAPVREHSRKPDELHGAMERLYGGPCCELFARESREGWSVWGNEVGRFDAAAPAPVEALPAEAPEALAEAVA